jgi:hypothetical protein
MRNYFKAAVAAGTLERFASFEKLLHHALPHPSFPLQVSRLPSVSHSPVPLAAANDRVQGPFKFWVGGEHIVGIGQGKEEEEEGL